MQIVKDTFLYFVHLQYVFFASGKHFAKVSEGLP